MDNYTGKRLDGRYEIQEVVGVGGMAVVYKAYDNIDDRTVAVKILKEEYLANEEFRRRFKNESKAIAVLSHPNIVKVYDVSYGDRLQYIVMEYVEGITLKEYIEQQGKLSIKESVHFTMQILRALQHAHDKGIVHRDIKPQNIMLLSNGNIKVTDFGIARFSYSDTKTMTDSAIGSVHYISPEQARGDITNDKADIYSVGVVMYEMLTGQLPFQSDNSVSVALMQLQSDPKRPREINSSIPVGLEQIVMHAMQKNVNDRYQSAAEMLLDIEEFKRNPTVRFRENYFVDKDPTKYITPTGAVRQPAVADMPQRGAAIPGNMPGVPAVNRQVQAPQQPVSEGEDDYYQEKSKLVPALIGIGIGLAVVALVVLGVWLIKGRSSGGKITVPNFKNHSYVDEIKDNADYKDNFVFTVEEVENSKYNPGVVFDQDPDAGTKVEKGTTIKLKVALVKVPIPDLTIYSANAARAAQYLDDNGFTNVVTVGMLSTEPEGKILSVEPAVGTVVAKNARIKITYASTTGFVAVPELVKDEFGVNLKQEDARLLLESVGLKLGSVKEEDNDLPAGTVLSQDTPAGENVYPGVSVGITVSSGKLPSSKAMITLTLPDYSRDGSIKVYINNELKVEKSGILLSGDNYSLEVEGAGAADSVKVYIDNSDYYSCIVDFTASTPVVTHEQYATPGILTFNKSPMPSVVGLKETEATNILRSSSFTNITVNTRYVYNKAEAGIVYSQSPEPSKTGLFVISKTYSPNEPITLVVNKLWEPETTVAAPVVPVQ